MLSNNFSVFGVPTLLLFSSLSSLKRLAFASRFPFVNRVSMNMPSFESGRKCMVTFSNATNFSMKKFNLFFRGEIRYLQSVDL